jgi:uncharacterized protein (DUF1800 family)
MSAQVLDPESPETTDTTEVGQPASIGRRRLLAVLGGAVGLAACSEIPGMPGVPGVPPSPPPSPGVPPPPTAPPPPPVTAGPLPTVLVNDPVRHLLRRATFGFGAADVAAVEQMGINAWLAQQLDPEAIDDGALEAYLGRYPALTLTSAQIADLDADNGGQEQADEDLVAAAVARQVFSNRKLFEVMAEFWANHFNVVTPSDDDRGRRTVEDREVLRANALGSFAQMLSALVQSPGMLRYLNQNTSRGDGDNVPNEDFARELMELHTVGRDNGYDEDDVKEAARLLTGLTFDNGESVFTYDPGRHYVGPVSIMGFTHPNGSAEGGLAAIQEFVAYLARLPQTATHLSTKLARRFVADEPPTSLVDSLAQAYLANDTAIVPWLQALFASAEFANSVGSKTRRPREHIAAAISALGLGLRGNPDNDGRLIGIARALQDAPYFWATPDGPPDTKEHWISSGNLLTRWNFNWDLTQGSYDEMLSSADEAFTALVDEAGAQTVGALVDAVAQRVVFQALAPEHRAAVLAYMEKAESDAIADADEAMGLAKSAAAAVLDSSYHIQR